MIESARHSGSAKPDSSRSVEPQPAAVRTGQFTGELVELAPAVRRYVFGMCGDWHQSEDLTQEVMLKALEKQDSFSGKSSFKTWIFTIARNKWLDQLRRKKSGPEMVTMENGHAELAVDSAPTPPRAAASAELARALKDATARLPQEQREALAMRESEGLTFAEIAEVINVPIGTVKSRVRYALLALAEELKPFAGELKA